MQSRLKYVFVQVICYFFVLLSGLPKLLVTHESKSLHTPALWVLGYVFYFFFIDNKNIIKQEQTDVLCESYPPVMAG